MFISNKHANLNKCKQKQNQALPRWIAGNHTFYFGKTCLFQDGGGDDKQNSKTWEKVEKKYKIALLMEHVEKQPDFVWEIDCTTSSNVQRARNRHKGFYFRVLAVPHSLRKLGCVTFMLLPERMSVVVKPCF